MCVGGGSSGVMCVVIVIIVVIGILKWHESQHSSLIVVWLVLDDIKQLISGSLYYD